MTNNEAKLFAFRNDSNFTVAFGNSTPSDEKKSVFAELFVTCLQECEKCGFTIANSFHCNPQLTIVTLPSHLPSSFDYPELPRLLQPVMDLIKYYNRPFGAVDDFFPFVIETITDYLRAPLTENAQISIQTKSVTYSPKIVVAEVTFLLDWLFQRSSRIISQVELQRKMTDTCALIVAHPEVAVEMFLPALVVLRRSILEDTWKGFDMEYKKKIIDITVQTFKTVVHHVDEYRLICCRLLICFVAGLHSIMLAETPPNHPKDHQVYDTVTQCILQLLSDTSSALSFSPVSFETLKELIKEWAQFPETTQGSCTELFINFWKAADTRMVVSIFPRFLHAVIQPNRNQLLKYASQMLDNNETGLALQIITWHFETAMPTETTVIFNEWIAYFGNSILFANTLVKHVSANAPSQSESVEKFEYLKEAAIRCSLAFLSYFSSSVQLKEQVTEIYQNLAELLSNAKYCNVILSHWYEEEDEMGCNNLSTVQHILSQLLNALSKTIHGAGFFIIPPRRSCPDLYEFYMKRLRKLDKKVFKTTMVDHMVCVIKMLSELKRNDLRITSAVVSLKCYAMQKILQRKDYAQIVANTFPEAKEYMEGLLRTLISIKDTVSVILLYLLGFLVHTTKEEAGVVPPQVVEDVMDVFPAFQNSQLVFPSLTIIGDLLFLVTRTQADALLKSTWCMFERVMTSDSSQGFDAITDLIFAWPSTLCEYPLVKSLCDAIKNPSSEKYLILKQLLNLAYQSKNLKDKEFILEDLKEGWLDVLPVMVSSVHSKKDKYVFRSFLKLFHSIFKEEEFVEGLEKKWPQVAESATEDLYQFMKHGESVGSILQCISDTLGIPYKKPTKRKRKQS